MSSIGLLTDNMSLNEKGRTIGWIIAYKHIRQYNARVGRIVFMSIALLIAVHALLIRRRNKKEICVVPWFWHFTNRVITMQYIARHYHASPDAVSRGARKRSHSQYIETREEEFNYTLTASSWMLKRDIKKSKNSRNAFISKQCVKHNVKLGLCVKQLAAPLQKRTCISWKVQSAAWIGFVCILPFQSSNLVSFR